MRERVNGREGECVCETEAGWIPLFLWHSTGAHSFISAWPTTACQTQTPAAQLGQYNIAPQSISRSFFFKSILYVVLVHPLTCTHITSAGTVLSHGAILPSRRFHYLIIFLSHAGRSIPTEDRSETSSVAPVLTCTSSAQELTFRPPGHRRHLRTRADEPRFMGPKPRDASGMACSACYYLVISSTHLSNGHFRRVKGVFRGPLCPAASSDSPVGEHAGRDRSLGVSGTWRGRIFVVLFFWGGPGACKIWSKKSSELRTVLL